MQSCVFCDIAQGKAKAHLIHETELSICLLDINPLARGHCLVIPKRHVAWWHECTPEETSDLFESARVVADKLMRAFKPDFVCMYARGRRIPHTHIFLIPTCAGDLLDRFFNTLELVQESPQVLTSMKEKGALETTARLLRDG